MGSASRAAALMLVLLSAGNSNAQQQETAGLSGFPVPVWPENGVIPPDLKGRYVFVDLAKGEYVLAYPGNLGTPDFEKAPAALQISRFELQRNVEPGVLVAINLESPNKYKYAYTVRNAAAARQWIDQWNIVLPEQVGNTAIRHPANWLSVIQKGRTFEVKNPAGVRSGASAFWFVFKPDDVVKAGTAAGGFALDSDLRPGFTVAYFRKGLALAGPIRGQGGIPKDVAEQLDSLLRLEYNSKTIVTLGPKFDANVDNATIASDYLEGMTFLSRSGVLNADSEFFKSVTTQLRQIAGAPASIRLETQPRTEVETEIWNALKISLRLN